MDLVGGWTDLIECFQIVLNIVLYHKNLIECQTALNLSMKEVKALIINSFKSSFLKEEKKNEWISKL